MCVCVCVCVEGGVREMERERGGCMWVLAIATAILIVILSSSHNNKLFPQLSSSISA